MNDESITAEIIKEMMVLKDTSEVSSEQVLAWAKRVEAQRSQNAVLENTRDVKEFDLIRRDRQRPGQKVNRQQRRNGKEKNSKLKIMGNNAPAKTMSSIWQNVQQMWEGKGLQSGMQKCANTETNQDVVPKKQGSPGDTTGRRTLCT